MEKISIVIPIYKPNIELLKEQIFLLLSQTVKPFEIIFIHTSLGEDVSELKVSPMIKILTITPQEFDHAKTRNMGIQNAKGDFVIMMTQDSIPCDSFLIENLYKPFLEDGIAISYGRQLAHKNSKIVEKYTRNFNYPPYDIIKSKEKIKELGVKTYFCSDVCSMYKKEYYNQLGGFPGKAIFNEDMVMAYKAIFAGYKVYYSSKAKVYHSHNYSWIAELKRNFDLGVSQKEFSYVFESVSSSKEGIKFIKSLSLKLLKKGKILTLMDFIIKCFFRFVGYFLGKRYNKLPQFIILKLTNSKYYFTEN